MNKEIRSSDAFQALRKKAEALLKKQGIESPEAVERHEIMRLAYELEVQGVELELQNEELRNVNEEKEVSRSEYADLYQSAPVAFITINSHGLIEKFNKTAFRMLSGNSNLLVGGGFSRLILPQDQGIYFNFLKKLSMSQETGSCELRLLDGKGNEPIYVKTEAGAEFDDTGQLSRWRLAFSDISERRRAEEALRQVNQSLEQQVAKRTESEKQFRLLVSASSEALYRMSPDWSEMRQLNSRFFLAETEEPSRTWLQKYIHSEDQPQLLAAIEKAVQNKSVFELEHRILRADGTLGWAFSRAVPLMDENGEIVEWFGAAKDITERQIAQKALRELIRKTIQAMENDRRTLSKEIHDSIGGSLAAIKMLLETRFEKLQSEDMGFVQEIISHLSDAIKESKRISQQLRPRVLDDFGLIAGLSEFIRAFNKFYPEIQVHQRIKILPHNIPEEIKTALYRVVQEALNNIGKHSRASSAKVELTESEDQIMLKVSDNGIGFDGSTALMTRQPLQGYGLLGMKERVEICRGTFQVESSPGKGTRLFTSIPKSP